MVSVKRLWKLLRERNLTPCLDSFERCEKEDNEAEELHDQMSALGLFYSGEKDDHLFEFFPPAFHIGSAIRLANHYGLRFQVGTHHGQCRAILDRDKWQREINRNVSLESLALFTVPGSYESIENFQGISDRMEMAICKCLIQARVAGVI